MKNINICVWIYGNGTEEFGSYHPYFTLISLLLKAAFKPCKRRKIEKGRQWKEEKRAEKAQKRKRTDFPLNFYIVTFGERKKSPPIRRKFSSLTPLKKKQKKKKTDIHILQFILLLLQPNAQKYHWEFQFGLPLVSERANDWLSEWAIEWMTKTENARNKYPTGLTAIWLTHLLKLTGVFAVFFVII